MGSTLAICPEIEHGEAQICSAPDSEGHTVNRMPWFLHSACLHDTPDMADLMESNPALLKGFNSPLQPRYGPDLYSATTFVLIIHQGHHNYLKSQAAS
jgi:hypothetical protein